MDMATRQRQARAPGISRTLPDAPCLGDLRDDLAAPLLGVTLTLQKRHQGEKP